MLDMRHFKVRGEEYVILKKDTLEEVISTAIALSAMFTRDEVVAEFGYGDANFDARSVTVEDEMRFWSQDHGDYRNIRELLLEVL